MFDVINEGSNIIPSSLEFSIIPFKDSRMNVCRRWRLAGQFHPGKKRARRQADWQHFPPNSIEFPENAPSFRASVSICRFDPRDLKPFPQTTSLSLSLFLCLFCFCLSLRLVSFSLFTAYVMMSYAPSDSDSASARAILLLFSFKHKAPVLNVKSD